MTHKCLTEYFSNNRINVNVYRLLGEADTLNALNNVKHDNNQFFLT